MARPCVIDLRDAAHRYAWDARKIDAFLAAAGIAPTAVAPSTIAPINIASSTTWRSFEPPPVIVAIVDVAQHEAIAPFVPWLARASRVVLVRDDRENWLRDDPDLRELHESDWRASCASLPVELLDWTDDASARAALARAIELALPLDDRAPTTPRSTDVELPVSAWQPWSGPTWKPEHVFAAAIAVRNDRVLIVDQSGTHDLASTPTLALPEFPVLAPQPHQRWANMDPSFDVRWSGVRMGTYWWHSKGPALLCRTEHDWPCGPAKKRWGGENNQPTLVSLAPDASACLHHFDFDVLFTEEVPLVWTRLDAVDVARFTLDPRRALFFQQTQDYIDTSLSTWSDGTDRDDDARELPPAMVLGPSSEIRYAIDLSHRTLRIRGHQDAAHVDHIGGPDGGYAIYNRDHELVRRGTGRLLGGWYRHATVEDRGAIWREDLATGTRSFVARAESIEGDVTHLAIPGTRNILQIGSGVYRVL